MKRTPANNSMHTDRLQRCALSATGDAGVMFKELILSASKRKKSIFALIALIFTLAILAIVSYAASKDSADKMVGRNLKFVYLKEANISFEPFNGRQIVWHFIYAVPNTFDEEFSIFTSVFGNIRFTNPTDLDYRLRKFEKLDIHPYSKQAGYELQPTTK